MSEIQIVPAEPAHIYYLGPRLRDADRKEARAMAGVDPELALQRSIVLSHETWVGTVDGEPVAIWGLGIGSFATGIGRPWLVGTEKIETNAIAFLRRNKACIRRWLGICPTLENWVMAEHETAIRWLEWLSFRMDGPVPHGPYGVPFRRFHLERG